jgi:hypothetical protein
MIEERSLGEKCRAVLEAQHRRVEGEGVVGDGAEHGEDVVLGALKVCGEPRESCRTNPGKSVR